MIAQYKRDLDKIKFVVKTAEKLDVEIQGYLAQHICVLTSGLIESSIRERLANYARAVSNPTVYSYVDNSINSFMNPKWEKIETLMNQFDKTWISKVQDLVGDSCKDAINSVVNNRHLIAHGRQAGLSLGVMKSYLKEVENFIVAVEIVVDPNS